MKADKQFQGRIPPTSLRHLFEDSDSLYRSLSPSINSLQANETPKQTDSSTPPVPYGGEFKACRDQIPRRSMYVPPTKIGPPSKLANSSYIRNLGTQLCFIGSSASCHGFGSICLLPQEMLC